ncbi:MAG: gephyrin-like molybdotransferase Glp [Chloroflexota bacterium]
MLGVDEAVERILALVRPCDPVSLPLRGARGMVLAREVIAPENVPPFRNSAMDGYALLAADTAPAGLETPVSLPVSGAVAAGDPPGAVLAPGAAIRIMTGAPMPAGADAVVRFEETDEGSIGRLPDRAFVAIHRAASPLDNVREAGEDVRAGSVLLEAGRALRPADLGLLAAAGLTEAVVCRRPRVAILSTGNEVVDPQGPLPPGAIRDSNATTLAAMAESWGAEAFALGIARDRLDHLAERLAAARGADMIVTSGGVSLGDFDMVKDALRAAGDIAVWQVRMKPGKPLAFGRIGGAPFLGLPGNPVAAAVSFEIFGRPAIRRMLGFSDVAPATVDALLLEELDNRGMRRHYVRAVVEQDAQGRWTARTAGAQGAGVLSSLSRANALLVLPESVERAMPGERYPAIMLDRAC